MSPAYDASTIDVAADNLAPGVARLALRTPTLPPATHTNSYLLGDREMLLVEPATPFPEERRSLEAWLRAEIGRGRKLVGVFATHHHPDHVGAFDIAETFDVPRYMHHATAVELGITDQAFARAPRFLVEGDLIELAGPSGGDAWRVLFTPGHARGHLCLWHLRDNALVVGDMVASVGTILIAKGEGHMTTYLAQLERLARCEAKVAFPAHGDAIVEPSALFAYYVKHRLQREARVLEAVMRAGKGSLDALLPLAYGDVAPEVFPVARLSLEAHLEKLSEDGRVVERDGVWAPREVQP